MTDVNEIAAAPAAAMTTEMPAPAPAVLPAAAPADAPADAPAAAPGDGAARKPRRRGGRNRNKGNQPEGAAPQAEAASGKPPAAGKASGNAGARKGPHPALEKLFELYPKLFGARFLPLKRGVYEELVARHPEDFKPEELKLAMGLHARSTRYLESVAAGHPRHDLEGQVVEPMAPEHVHHAILELYRRRLGRAPQAEHEALRAQAVTRIARAIEASGLGREDYAVLVRSRDAGTNAIVDEALASLAGQDAKAEALLRAFEASGKSEQEFADMYGMKPGEVTRTLQRARAAR